MILDKFSMAGRAGIVTGAAGGIGRAIARGLAEAGASVIVADINEEGLKETAKYVSEVGKCEAIVVDLTKDESIDNLFAKSLEAFGDLHFLFNNAGVIHRDPCEDFSKEMWDLGIRVNLTAPFLLSQKIAKHWIEKSIKGSIINTSSLIAIQGGRFVPAYAATKGGLTQLTKTMCNDWGKYGINVNAIGPGWIKTEMTAALRADPERMPAITGRIPMGRWADPEELVGAAVFLASDASSYINGHVIFVDGGWLAF